jgi:hypothetical protein
LRGCRLRKIIINPKILNKAQLYGHFDESGNEYKDGVFLKFLRDAFTAIEENNQKE